MPETQPSFLYVEDDPSSRRLIKLIMTNVLGYSELTIFESSENFLDKVRALPAVPDVVFLDVHIAPLNGFEMLKLLRSEPAYQQIPVIAMTASVMASDIQQLKAAGFDGLIGKPIRKKVFPEQLKQIMAGEPIWVAY